MKQKLEIEYKNLLNKTEYQKILDNEFNNTSLVHKIKQTNHYFDTNDKLLKKNQSAVRIRIFEDQSELTFKVPSQEFLMETNFPLNDAKTEAILKNKYFSLDEITNKIVDLGIPSLTNHSIFKHFNQFETLRYEKKIDDNLIVLDKTTFQNDTVDYELEVECVDPLVGDKFFHSLLDKYSVPKRPTLPKIARAENNRS